MAAAVGRIDARLVPLWSQWRRVARSGNADDGSMGYRRSVEDTAQADTKEHTMLDDLEVIGGDLQHIDDDVASGGVWRRCLRRSQGARCIGEELDDLREGRGRVDRAKGECGEGGRGGSRRRGGWTRLTGGSWFCLARKRRLQTNANNAWPNALRAVVCTGAN